MWHVFKDIEMWLLSLSVLRSLITFRSLIPTTVQNQMIQHSTLMQWLRCRVIGFLFRCASFNGFGFWLSWGLKPQFDDEDIKCVVCTLVFIAVLYNGEDRSHCYWIALEIPWNGFEYLLWNHQSSTVTLVKCSTGHIRCGLANVSLFLCIHTHTKTVCAHIAWVTSVNTPNTAP